MDICISVRSILKIKKAVKHGFCLFYFYCELNFEGVKRGYCLYAICLFEDIRDPFYPLIQAYIRMDLPREIALRASWKLTCIQVAVPPKPAVRLSVG